MGAYDAGGLANGQGIDLLNFLSDLGAWQFTVVFVSLVAIAFILAWLVRELAPDIS